MRKKSNRRNFLSKAIQAIIPVSMGAPIVEASAKQVGKKIKFLTSDGKLIELDQEVIKKEAVKSGKKASNSEILNWTKQVKTKPPDDE